METVDSRRNWALIDEMLTAEKDEWRQVMLMEGPIRVPFAGEMLLALGVEQAEAGRFYATRGRAVTFWPFAEDGRIIGEDIYNMTTDISEAEEITLNPYSFGEQS